MSTRILWADDEIELLRPAIMFLEQRGYQIHTATNGADAVQMCRETPFDLMFLDENMPGLTGLEVLADVKRILPTMPVVMITKSEEENIMDQAIGGKIADYLIKPVRPNQLLLAIKKHLDSRQIVNQHTTATYREEYPDIAHVISHAGTLEEFQSIHRTLSHWQIELQSADESMRELLRMQQADAEKQFARLVRDRYTAWIRPGNQQPLMSQHVIRDHVLPLCDAGKEVFLVVIDNFRYDQWLAIRPMLSDMFIQQQDIHCLSLLPTATQYARNALFSGLLPGDIMRLHPDLWVDEGDEESKNQHEGQLLELQLKRSGRPYQADYHKINDSDQCERLIQRLPQLHRPLHAIVLNFIDMLSHSRTESRMMRELAGDEAAYLSLTRSWFRHSPTYRLLQQIATRDCALVLTTDHGTIRVDRPVKLQGDRNTNTNLRYKIGRNLAYDTHQLFTIANPRQVGLPAPQLSTSYVFATQHDFITYPNNYNHYASQYRNTFQHGGVSMQEMLIPLIILTPKNI
ncbi:MAG: PglZ domain-containing protein [Paludibacteraceae bacterium]|nr:PglZ domain-containing protein [Paludibacteraceae bacterium]